ncbi:MAG: hypothetical protein V9E81_05190 [Marmoricola sp.]
MLAQTLAAGGWVDLGKVDIEPHRVLAAARSASNLPHDQILRFDSYGGWYDQRHIAYLEEEPVSARGTKLGAGPRPRGATPSCCRSV